jgi:hypothetical protein
MIHKLIWVLVIALFLIFVFSCDLEKLSGYDYSYNPPPESAIFTGTIFNRFTLEPVQLSEINIANQVTYSDESGQYILYYHYGEDDEKNKPVDIKISAENYQDVDTSIIVFPENKLNVYLPYAAPIIKKIALVDSFFVIQAIVFDYQGFNDIATVSAQYSYRRPGEKPPSLHLETKLTRVFVDSLNTSYYQSRVDRSIAEYGNIIFEGYSVKAKDRKHNQDFMNDSEGGTDSLLFPYVKK